MFIRECDGAGDINTIADRSAAEIYDQGRSRLVGGPR
jgi:hypothetical protein